MSAMVAFERSTASSDCRTASCMAATSRAITACAAEWASATAPATAARASSRTTCQSRRRA
eukprot:984733-Prorocentrum_minimum.AAC.1